MFSSAGGEVARVPDEDSARAWLADFLAGFAAVAIGTTVPDALADGRPTASTETAPVGVSMSRGAVAETGSLVLDARDVAAEPVAKVKLPRRVPFGFHGSWLPA